MLPNQDSEQSSNMWMDDSVSNFSMGSSNSYNDNTEVPRKSRKRTPRQRPGPKPAAREETGMDVFDADSAKAPHFVLSQLGSDTKVTPKVRLVTLLVVIFYLKNFKMSFDLEFKGLVHFTEDESLYVYVVAFLQCIKVHFLTFSFYL